VDLVVDYLAHVPAEEFSVVEVANVEVAGTVFDAAVCGAEEEDELPPAFCQGPATPDSDP